MINIVYSQIEKQLIMEELIELEKRNEDQLNDGTVYDSSQNLENDEFQIMKPTTVRILFTCSFFI